MNVFYFLLFLIISCNSNELISENVDTYDMIFDYINQLVYTVYSKDNDLYNEINYYDKYKIISKLKNINISDIKEIKMDYNPIVYKNVSRDDRAIMSILTRGANEDIYIYKCDNFGNSRINNTYNWELVKIINTNKSDVIFDMSVNLGEYYDRRVINIKPPNMSRWILCFTEKSMNVSCLGSSNGIDWVHPNIIHDINEDTNCSSLRIMKTAFDTWGTFCYDTDRYKIKNYGFILFNGTFMMENVRTESIISYEDNIVFSSKFYDDNNFNSIIVVNNSVHRLLYVRNIYYNNDIEGNITNIILKPEDNGWYFVIDNNIYLTYDRANYEYINTIDGDIKDIINMYDGRLMVITYKDGKLYTNINNITSQEKNWPFYESKNNTNDISYVEGNLTFNGKINIIHNISVSINGNLDINTNLILNKTDTININGKLSVGGNLTIYTNSTKNIILFKFNETNNKTFDDVQVISDNKLCNEHLEYSKHTIILAFDPLDKCEEDNLTSYIIIISVCLGIFVIFLVTSLVLVFKFREKIFPYRDKEYYDEK